MDARRTLAIAQTALENSPVFQKLPGDVLAKLAGTGRYEYFRQPTLIQAEGEMAGHLRYVISGHIIAKASSRDGSEAELIPITTGQWSSWIGTYGKDPMVQNYWSSADASFIAFPSDQVRKLTLQHSLIFPPMLDEIGGRFRTVLKWIWNTSLNKNEVMMARHLLLISGAAAGETNVSIISSQDSLARMLGLSRQTLSRHLKALEEHGLIAIGYRTLTIRSVQALREFAGHPETISETA